MNSIDTKRHMRANYWLERVYEDIGAGGFGLPHLLSSARGDPDSGQWAAAITRICAYPKKERRLAMMKTALQHPDLPSKTHERLCLFDALNYRAHECTPLLHAAGFRLTPSPNNPDRFGLALGQLAYEISKGRWPHADLIYPGLLNKTPQHAKIIDGLIAGAGRSGYSVNVPLKVSKLPQNAAFNQRLSQKIGSNAELLGMPGEDALIHAKRFLLPFVEAGWIDFDLARQSHKENNPGGSGQLLAELEVHCIQMAAPQTNLTRKSMRL